jgi:serine/threonine protein kinase
LSNFEHKECSYHLDFEELKEKVIKDSKFDEISEKNLNCISETEKQIKDIKEFLQEKKRILSKLRRNQIKYETLKKKITIIKKFYIIKGLEAEINQNNSDVLENIFENEKNNKEVASYMNEVLNIHSKNIIHKDFKPDIILLKEENIRQQFLDISDELNIKDKEEEEKIKSLILDHKVQFEKENEEASKKQLFTEDKSFKDLNM